MKSKKFSISFQDESFQKILPLNAGKYTIGSDSNCDITIEHADVSKYLGVIIVTAESLTFVNTADAVGPDGKEIMREEVDSSLELHEGTFHFEFKAEEISLPNIPQMPIVDASETVDQSVDSVEPPELDYQKPVQEQAFDMDKVQIYNRSGSELKLIEDEWCDIIFDESHFKPVNDYAFAGSGVNFEDFIDTDEEIDVDEAYSDVFSQADKHSIEVAFLVNGIVSNIDYFSANEAKIYLSSDKESHNTFQVETFDHQKYAFAFCNTEGVVVRDIPGFTKQLQVPDRELQTLPEGEYALADNTIIYTCGVTQIIVKQKLLPPKIKLAPWLRFDKDFAKVAMIVWLLILVPLIGIMIFTTIEQAEKKKEIAVIYKKIKGVKKDSKLSQAVAGPVTKEQPKKEEPKKSVEKKKVEKKIVQKKQPSKSKNQKVAKNKPAKAKVKRYSFNSASKVSTILGKTSSNNAKSASRSASVGALPSSSSSSLANGFGEVRQKVGTLGKGGGRAGYDRNVAGTGYGSKNGVDTSYISSETKVLGSIDPELIRKILREHLEQFRYCYQKELINNDVSGVFYLDFQINGRGRAPSSKTKVTTKAFKFSGQTTNCLRKVVALIQFPKPKGGGVVDIRQPLNFVSAKNR